jgi:hypothetical protein
MKILKSVIGKKPKEVAVKCCCGCEFQFAASEARFVPDWRDGNAYVIRCPECHTDNWVAASLFR